LALVIVTIVLRYRLLPKVALTISSLFLFHFLLFCTFEKYPDLISRAHFDKFTYYALKLCCAPDDKLVFREIPASGRADYPGDRYSPIYNVQVPSIHMEWSTDKDGFRHNHPADTSDIVVIGDSYVAFGENEEDTFGRRLQRLTGLSVQNLGVGGYGPFQYLEILKMYGVPRKPQYALFCFYEGNDIRDIAGYLAWRRTGRYNGRYFGQAFWGRYITALTDEVGYFWRAGQSTIELFINNRNPPPDIHPDVAVVRVGN